MEEQKKIQVEEKSHLVCWKWRQFIDGLPIFQLAMFELVMGKLQKPWARPELRSR